MVRRLNKLAIEALNIHKSYGKAKALNGLTLKIGEGEI